MPFRFTYLCDLLEKLEDYRTRDPPLLPARQETLARKAIEQWFKSHRVRIDAFDTSTAALLSALFPERRTDRVYGLREANLVRLLGRVLEIGISRRKLLEQWKEAGQGDLGKRVELVQSQAEMPLASPGRQVTIEQIDSALTRLAARCRFSSPEVRRLRDSPPDNLESILRPVFHRLQSREAKWLTRMILKSYLPVVLPEDYVLRQYHFLMPDLLRFQSKFEAVAALLRGPVLGGFPAYPGTTTAEDRLKEKAKKELVPLIGVKVGRINFLKARSIKHCLQMAAGNQMSLERKYDGEYCQIHIDLLKGDECIQIFSKSGKDSTRDRHGIQSTLRKCLRMGGSSSKLKSKCILEGEMVVFSDKTQSILPFHTLRKHLPRSGQLLGAAQDSPKYGFEHLMIIFFDILLLDNQAVLTKTYNERMMILNDVILQEPGRAELCWRQHIDCALESAASQLKKAFARGIAARWEGFVLKPINEPYFSLKDDRRSSPSWIKLKKDYINGLGDTADFAVVGAGFDPHSARELGLEDARWTHFHLGCLENREDVIRFGEKPRLRVIEALDQTINKTDRKTILHLGLAQWKPYQRSRRSDLDIQMEDGLSCRMEAIFPEPFVIEVMGGGFDRPADKAYYTLRWPRVVKVHHDRSFKEVISFAELQEMAQEAGRLDADTASQEERDWIWKLEGADPKQSRKERSADDDQSSPQASSADELETCRRSSHSSGRTRSDQLPQLVRIDTGELLPRAVPASTLHARPRVTARLTRSLPTPPSSSPLEGVEEVTIDKRTGFLSNNLQTPRRKRKASEIADKNWPQISPRTLRHKARRLDIGISSMTSSEEAAPNPANLQTTGPLAEMSNTRLPPEKTRASSQGSSARAREPASSRPRKADRIEKAATSLLCAPTSTSSRCNYISSAAVTSPRRRRSPRTSPETEKSSAKCLLHNSITLLAPCIAHMPYLTSDLLPAHGIKQVLSPKDLLEPNFSPSPQRIMFIETHRTHASVALLREVKRLKAALFVPGKGATTAETVGANPVECNGRTNIQKPPPSLDQVQQATPTSTPTETAHQIQIKVYDWRLLECVDMIERRYASIASGELGEQGRDTLKQSSQQHQNKIVGFDFWNRCFVCSL